jgi:thiamine-phosphate pyrophosphorylase
MLVTDDRLVEGRDVIGIARAAERGGVTAIQLRLKSATPRELAGLARELIAILAIPLLVNDRPDVALAAGAAGVHLGPDDLPVSLARKIAPPGFVIGASVGSEDEAGLAGEADYWGIGPWRETKTKGGAGVGLGVDGFVRLRQMSRGRPCLAIGSVLPADVGVVRSAGGAGVAVASGILGADDVEAAARSYRL